MAAKQMTPHSLERLTPAANRDVSDVDRAEWDADGEVSEAVAAPMLVFDGGCPFCRHFAELSELRGGIPGLRIRDGRADAPLRQALAKQGFHLRDGAMVIDGERVWHGAEAIHWLCARMTPSAALLQALVPLMANGERARGVYPLLLLARRLALGLRGLPVDPEARG